METKSRHFIQEIIDEDLKSGKHQKIHTRFPPEPNGYLHIGHAKAICLNFGLAAEYNGLCNLRFDDTNPQKEEEEYISSIIEDIRWLGYNWQDRLYYTSEYFETLYQTAVELIKKGLAYVCDLSQEETRLYRGTLTESGKSSPFRDRSVDDNLRLFKEMREGRYADGEKVLKAKIDMASPNINLRDPVLYRIQRAVHPRTGDTWRIYPMYDYAHPISDALEGITHSICTLEFENHRPLYDWVMTHANIGTRSRQIEFARLNITYTVMSKRKLRQLVEGGYVDGWDDPRMPTLAGIRRRGYTPSAIRAFSEMIGIAKANSMVEIEQLEYCIRADLNPIADRVMTVIDPIKITLTNYPDTGEMLWADNNPERPENGGRQLNFGKTLYIERDDFMETPVKGFHRLTVGGEVRLKHAYIIKCEKALKDEAGNITELLCTYDKDSKSGEAGSARKIKGTIHWVDAETAADVEIRLYERLFDKENPSECEDGKTFIDYLNPDSRRIKTAKAEAALANPPGGKVFQFLRQGYFIVDPDSTPGMPVFNRIVSLKDGWSKKRA